ncbi:polycomb protein suz12-B [Danaus plexippus]|uniref:Polycomb protein suz12-B n=1 Tax=Danaus plexippus plexippus TaxID=278856 RepID=A0A212FPA0_DANPL|nr:polycomb protein suz12-B [Danaus plexippus]OWR55530.1 polycomb protein suz12-B [Danaus plexippus plexippus]
MPPKKREKESETNKNSKIDHLQADHELFLQAFEKPTQIYRFLRTRNMLSPIFLNRTLSYMKRRMSRSNKSRIGFKVDSLLEKITLKKSTELQLNSLGGYMTLTFLGFYDKSLEEPSDYQVKVETLLLKICHKKRKESSSAIVEVSVGSCSVPLNPSTSEPPAMASAVSISSDTFSPSHGPNVKSYMLMLRVTVTKASMSNGASSTEITNGDDEPLTKRLKSSSDINSSTDNKWSKLYGSELIVYDKHNRCLLTNGEYDLVLHDVTPGGRSATIARSPHKALMAQWETIPNENDLQTETNPFDIFKVRPLLKLKLSWSQEPTNGLVNRPKLYQQDSNGVKKDNTAKEKISTPRCSTSEIKNGEKSKQESTDSSKRQQIIYQFLYNNNSRQQTEACDDLHCPWCSLDCGALYSLLKHLKLCHSRFNFTYFPIPGGARIDVSINELYDGSYTGSPHDLIAAQGRSRGGGPRAGPTRRASLTHLLVLRRRRHRHSLAEFLELDDNDVDAQRPYLTGHNRLYHHTITCLPVYPNELDIDSESETDPLWLQQKTMMMIDEFTDVNEGEKELMKMWNLHVMKYNYVGDCQIPLACQMFLQMKGKELLEKNLYRNFILHMCSLHDFGLLSPVALYQTVQMLNQMLADSADAKEKMRESLRAQRDHWNAVGKFQQPVIIEQKPNNATVKLNNVEASPSVRRKTSNLQNANRMGSASSNFNKSSSPGPANGETKRKMSSGSIQSRKRSSISERKSSV